MHDEPPLSLHMHSKSQAQGQYFRHYGPDSSRRVHDSVYRKKLTNFFHENVNSVSCSKKSCD